MEPDAESFDAGTGRPAPTGVLIVGPLPPPMGGAPVTVKEMIEELAKDPALRVSVVNTSPRGDVRKNAAGVDLERLDRLVIIVAKYIREIRRARVVLVFANDFFALTVVPLLLAIARLSHKAFFIKPVGGDLDVYLAGSRGIIRRRLLKTLRSADGILAQTRQLQAELARLGCGNVHYLPGCRSKPAGPEPRDRNGDDLRLLFLGHIIEEKGPLVLLEALARLSPSVREKVRCDFFGPIHDSVKVEFLAGLDKTPSACYRGETPAGNGAELMLGYDALVLPTFFPCEGHPGVIIEAMHAGIPVVSTRHRAIPELITSGENGLLVPIKDPDALAAAMTALAEAPDLTRRMGQANRRRGLDFSTDVVVGRMKGILFARS